MIVKVCDTIMGAGKTESAITLMNQDKESRYVFITPYLDEVERIKRSCSGRKFKDPQSKGKGKLENLHYLLSMRDNIASTHALFESYNDETISLIQDGGYKLILDEVFQAVQTIPISPKDLQMLKREMIEVDSEYRVRWVNDDYEGRFEDLRDMCMTGNVILYNDCLLLWKFPIEVFQSFDEVIILTYMFDAQVQKYYFDIHNIEVQRIGTVCENGVYHFSDTPHVPDYVAELPKKIHIIEDEKLNKIGEMRSSLSVSWYKKARDTKGQPLIKQLRNNLTNLFKNMLNSSSDRNLWTVFKDYQALLKGKGYTKGFLSCNVRATVFIYEEFRMIVKSIIDTVLSPTLFQRQIPFRIKYPDEYKELKEEPKEIYISSAWYKSHWMWDYMKLVTRDMLGKGKSVLIGMDYSIALKHEIKTRDFLVKERKKLDRVAWTIEYENQMVAENAHAYFTYDMLNKNRVLKRPFYPRKNEDVLSKIKAKHTIPKQAGEIRIVACDIAPEGGTGNDNSVFTCIRALPESKEYKVSDTSGDHIEVKQGYRRQVVYMEPQAEFETTKQAIRIKQLFADFEADYCVLDTRNAGVAIYDALAKVLYDVDRNVEYEPWTCMNDDKLKARIVIAGQKEVVFSVKASLELNSKIAVSMRDSLNNRMIELMVSNQEGVEELQRLYPEYASADVDTQLFYERPFLETVALINEMIGLEYTVQNQTNLIKIEERPGARKDRYTSVSYGNYFVSLLEADLFSDSSGYEYVTLCN